MDSTGRATGCRLGKQASREARGGPSSSRNGKEERVLRVGRRRAGYVKGIGPMLWLEDFVYRIRISGSFGGLDLVDEATFESMVSQFPAGATRGNS